MYCLRSWRYVGMRLLHYSGSWGTRRLAVKNWGGEGQTTQTSKCMSIIWSQKHHPSHSTVSKHNEKLRSTIDNDRLVPLHTFKYCVENSSTVAFTFNNGRNYTYKGTSKVLSRTKKKKKKKKKTLLDYQFQVLVRTHQQSFLCHFSRLSRLRQTRTQTGEQ